MTKPNPTLGEKHPTLMGYRLEVVPDGTTVTDERTGEQVTVVGTVSAMAGGTLFCTEEVYRRLMDEFGELKQ